MYSNQIRLHDLNLFDKEASQNEKFRKLVQYRNETGYSLVQP